MWIWWSFRPFSHLRLFDSISTHLSPLDAYMNFLIFLKLKNPSFSEHACTLLLPCIVSIWHPYHPPPQKKSLFPLLFTHLSPGYLWRHMKMSKFLPFTQFITKFGVLICCPPFTAHLILLWKRQAYVQWRAWLSSSSSPPWIFH